MASLPNFERLKDLCGSNDIKHCFQYLFMQEVSENDAFLVKLGELCDGFREKIEKFDALIEEGQSFSESDDMAMDGMECLEEAQMTNREILEALVAVLDVASEAGVEKRRHVTIMEIHD